MWQSCPRAGCSPQCRRLEGGFAFPPFTRDIGFCGCLCLKGIYPVKLGYIWGKRWLGMATSSAHTPKTLWAILLWLSVAPRGKANWSQV